MNPAGTPIEPDKHPTGSFGTQTPSDPSSDAHPPSDLPADSRFRPLRLHREGGMGRVHVALDAELNRQVAFKEIRPGLTDNPAAVEHFLFEAEVTGRLEHPGVVPVYGLGRYPDGRPYYAMRFIDGVSLRDAIGQFHSPAEGPQNRADRALALRHLLTRFVAVCQTLAFAHSRGIVHRDLKPHNVLLGPFGETLVVDWGLARRARGEDQQDPARAFSSDSTRQRIGTPAYWSPEQAAGLSERHDERTDVYGLGAVLYQLLTGSAPHPSGEHEPPPPSPKSLCSWVDDDLDAIAMRALARRREDRFATALALAEEVERWLAEQPVAAQRSAVAALARKAAEHRDDPVLAEQLARQRVNLGLMLTGMGRDADAVEELEAAAAAFARLSAADPNRPRYRAEEANCYLALAQPLANLGRPADAAAREKQATAIYNGLIAAHPEEYRANLASIMVTHADGSVHVAPTPPAAEPESAQRTHDGSLSVPAVAPTTAPVGPTTASRPPVPEPELLQGYAVVRVLGQGAFGQILLARDNALDRLVAIKDFRADLSDTARVRAVREMQVTARLIHPNVVRVYTYGVHAGTKRPFLVMEYIPGHTLREEALALRGGRQAREEPAFVRLIAAIAQACDGIHFAHTQGVLHRDPKPSNVMIHEDGRAVVVDWGLSKVLGAEPEAAADLDAVPKVGLDLPAPPPVGKPAANDPMITQEGAILGTPAYVAPEQARGSAPTARGDVYVLGAGLFEVLTGEPPHTGMNLNEVMRQLLFGKTSRPRDLNPSVPVELEAVCAVAMARNPDDRYPTAAAMAEDLRAWLSGKPLSIRNRGRLRRLWDQLTGRG
jgi:serine/threonine protein kinase